HHSRVARAAGEPRSFHAARFPCDGQSRLARSQSSDQDRQRLSFRAAALRSAVLQTGFCRQGQSRGPMVKTADSSIDARRLGQTERHDGLKARNELLRPGDLVTARIQRSDPSSPSAAPRIEEYRVAFRKRMRVLDVLNEIAEHDAPDLAYRWFCGSKMCGTCAVRMNGREVLACWEAVEPKMIIEPLRNLSVVRDLVVDRSRYEKKVASLEPWLERTGHYPGFPESLSHKEMQHASRALDCISCMCCYSACPVIGLGELTDFAGPAPLVQLGQTALDPRNEPQKIARSLAQTAI